MITRVSPLGLILLVLGLGGCQALKPGVPLARSGPDCVIFDALDDREAALRLETTPQRLALMRSKSGLRATQLCAMGASARADLLRIARPPKAGYPDDAARYHARLWADENGVVDPLGRPRAVAARQAMLAAEAGLGKAAGDAWSSLGPIDVGGRVRSLLIHPGSPERMWAGSVTGGLFVSINGGASWSSVNDFADTLVIGSLAMEPGNPEVIYVGTGEYATRTDGNGIYKSTDGGRTFRQLPATAPERNLEREGWFYVNRIAIHPGARNRLLVATRRGCFRSDDAGATFRRATPLDPDHLAVGITTDAKFDPHDPARAICGGLDGGLWLTTDDGGNWRRIQLANLPESPTQQGRVEVAFAPSAPGTVYAAVDNNLGEVYRSTDGGSTWALLSTPAHFRTSAGRSQGSYDNMIWVNPVNANQVVIGGIDVHLSFDGGQGWTPASRSIHADQHLLVPHPGYNGTTNRRVYVTNDGGIYTSADVFAATPGNAAGRWAALNYGLVTTQFYSGSGALAGNGQMVGGTQDNGTFISRRPGVWEPLFGGDGGRVAIDPVDPRYVYGEYVRLALFRSFDGGFPETICAGITEALGDNGWCGGEATGEANFIAPFVLDPNAPARILAGANSLWVTDNARAPEPQWRVIKRPLSEMAPGASNTNYISAIAVSPGRPDVVFVGHNDGDLFRSADARAAVPEWTAITALPRRTVTSINVDAANPDVVVVTLGGFSADNLWRSRDGGITWAALATGLPAAPAYSFARHPLDANRLFLGTEVGVFTSRDNGATWSATADGPAAVSVRELSWYTNTTLLAATYGRGMFIADFPSGATTAERKTVVEYYNAGLDHYFVTLFDDEIAKLDSGFFRGWARTGRSFKAWTSPAAAVGLSPVCRLYGNPARGLDSHFYSASPQECAETLTRFGDAWLRETPSAFYIGLPDTVSGICAAGTTPVYRLYNARADVNHRYTTDITVRQQMVTKGYVPEGYGSDGVIMCAPL